jgi:hypothetical protein
MPPDLNVLPADEQEIIKKCIKEAKAKAAARAARREQKLARRAARDAGTPVPGRNTKKGKYAARNAKKKAKKEKRKREQEEGPEREGLRKYFTQLREEFVAGTQQMLRSELQKFRKSMLDQVGGSGSSASGLRR